MTVIQYTALLGHDMLTTKAKTLNHMLSLLREVVKSLPWKCLKNV